MAARKTNYHATTIDAAESGFKNLKTFQHPDYLELFLTKPAEIYGSMNMPLLIDTVLDNGIFI